MCLEQSSFAKLCCFVTAHFRFAFTRAYQILKDGKGWNPGSGPGASQQAYQRHNPFTGQARSAQNRWQYEGVWCAGCCPLRMDAARSKTNGRQPQWV